MEQLSDVPHTRSLVDEMYFEHHVNLPEMNPSWNTFEETTTIVTSYELFTQLRNAGIRMHSWP